MINKFKEVFPKAQVSMYEAQLSSFLPAIRDGRLDFAIGTLSAEMKFRIYMLSRCWSESCAGSQYHIRTCTRHHHAGVVEERTVGVATNQYGVLQRASTTLQRNGISIENMVTKTDSVVTIYNLVLNADFLTVIPCDMTSPFGSINLLLFRLKKHYLWHNMPRYGRKIIVLKKQHRFWWN
ncbi:LysR substrate-binding domain-containing protein [Escherichia coli]